MKKFLTFLFCAVMCVSLVACGEGSGGSPSENINGQLGDVMDDVNSESNEDTFAGENETGSKEDVPEHIQNFYNLLKEYTENNDVSFYLENDGVVYDSSSKAITGLSSFDILLESNDPDALIPFTVSFTAKNKQQADKSFHLNFDMQTDGKFAKDFICAALYATNPEKSTDTIKNEMQQLVNSYNGDDFSMVLDNGDCVFLIDPVDAFGFSSLRVQYKDEFFSDMEPVENYSELIIENALSEMNKGDLVYFTGKVIESEYGYRLGQVYKSYYVKCELEDSQIVYLTYLFEYSPVEFHEGQTYKFYGNIAAPANQTPLITLHGYETVDS